MRMPALLADRLSVWADRLLKQKVRDGHFVQVYTTFATREGPKPRTIWFDSESKDRYLFQVQKVAGALVTTNLNDHWTLKEFMDAIRSGRLIFVGVLPTPFSHTETA